MPDTHRAALRATARFDTHGRWPLRGRPGRVEWLSSADTPQRQHSLQTSNHGHLTLFKVCRPLVYRNWPKEHNAVFYLLLQMILEKAVAPTPVLLPGKPHGRGAWWAASMVAESDMAERVHFHFSLLCIGEGNGSPLQRSCLENPRDGVAQRRTRLKRLSSSSADDTQTITQRRPVCMHLSV